MPAWHWADAEVLERLPSAALCASFSLQPNAGELVLVKCLRDYCGEVAIIDAHFIVAVMIQLPVAKDLLRSPPPASSRSSSTDRNMVGDERPAPRCYLRRAASSAITGYAEATGSYSAVPVARFTSVPSAV